MNRWMSDPRAEKGEVAAFEAERAERRGDFAQARARYHAAGEAFASVAAGVPPTHPNTRTDLAIAAVASFARAGDFGQAIEFARRMLAEGDALTEHGKAELLRLVQEYTVLLPGGHHRPQQGRGKTLRDEVRRSFDRIDKAA